MSQTFYEALSQPKAVQIIQSNRKKVTPKDFEAGKALEITSIIKTYAELRTYAAFKCEMLAIRFEKNPTQWRYIATYSELFSKLSQIEDNQLNRVQELLRVYSDGGDGGDIWNVMDFIEGVNVPAA